MNIKIHNKKKISKFKFFYITIEMFHREINSALNLMNKAIRSGFIVIVGDNERKFSNWFFLHTLLKVSAFLCISSVILLMGNTTFRYSLNPYSLYLAIGMLAPGLMLLLFVLLFMYFHEKIDDRKGYCVYVCFIYFMLPYNGK